MTDRLSKATRRRVSRAGGKARAARLSRERRTRIAQDAALARWRGKRPAKGSEGLLEAGKSKQQESSGG